MPEDRGIRVLLADEDKRELADLAELVEQLGYEVTGRTVTVEELRSMCSEVPPDVAIVKLHSDDDHALRLIEELAEGGDCPLLATMEVSRRAVPGACGREGDIRLRPAAVLRTDRRGHRGRHLALPQQPQPLRPGHTAPARAPPARGDRAGERDPDGASLARRAGGLRAHARLRAAQQQEGRACRGVDHREPSAAAQARPARRQPGLTLLSPGTPPSCTRSSWRRHVRAALLASSYGLVRTPPAGHSRPTTRRFDQVRTDSFGGLWWLLLRRPAPRQTRRPLRRASLVRRRRLTCGRRLNAHGIRC